MKVPKFVLALLIAIQLLTLQTSSVEGRESINLVEPSIAPNAPVASIVNQTDTCDPDALGEKIKQKSIALSDNVCATSDIANRDSTGFFTKEKKDFYAKQCERSKEIANDPKAASKFAETGKGKKDSACYTVEREGNSIGDDDGICTQSEKIKGACQEAIGDVVGNDDGVCEELREFSNEKGKKIKTWETCEEVCTVSEEEVANDCSQLEAMDGLLEDTNDNLVNKNTLTILQLQALAQQQQLTSEIGSVVDQQEEGICESVLLVNTPRYSGEGRPNDWYTSWGAYQSYEFATLATNGCTDFTNDATKGWCFLFHLVQTATSEGYNLTSMLDEEITATRIDQMSICIEKMSQSNARLEAKNVNFEKKLDEIIRLLNTPAGRRDTFPTK